MAEHWYQFQLESCLRFQESAPFDPAIPYFFALSFLRPGVVTASPTPPNTTAMVEQKKNFVIAHHPDEQVPRIHSAPFTASGGPAFAHVGAEINAGNHCRSTPPATRDGAHDSGKLHAGLDAGAETGARDKAGEFPHNIGRANCCICGNHRIFGPVDPRKRKDLARGQGLQPHDPSSDKAGIAAPRRPCPRARFSPSRPRVKLWRAPTASGRSTKSPGRP